MKTGKPKPGNIPVRVRRERGQAVVEFAMVMPILILLLMGVVFFAMAFNLQMVLNAAAREGARAWASNRSGTNPCTPDDTAITDHYCDPTKGGSDFEKNIVPLVKKYITDNGYSGDKVYFERVLVTKKDLSPQELVENRESIEDASKVRLVVYYPYSLPTVGLNFELITLRAEYTFKRGS